MIILGIETSCDETSAAVLSFDSAQDNKKKGRIQILSNIVASSASLQAKYGGVLPEQAAREQIKSIIPVVEETLTQAFPDVIPAKAGIQKTDYLWIPDQVRDDKGWIPPIDAIAVTYGPGLIGSLLVGVETAKTLSLVWNKPLIPVNHLIGHFYANWIETTPPTFPCIGLLVSGGHTDLVLFTDHGKYKYLGGTRDDAAGECFDKCARLLGLPYPGGPEISRLAKTGKDTYKLPRPMIDSKDFDFSFSGLKTAVANLLHTPEVENCDYTSEVKCNLAASIEAAIVDVLVEKTIRAAQRFKVEQIMIAGGVASNEKLVRNFKLKAKLFVPPPSLCTDNAAMIAAAGFFSPRASGDARRGEAGQKPLSDPLTLQADPSLALQR